jgi:hypothetical protein
MKFLKSKWLIYTFFVGLIPVLTRLLAWTITRAGVVTPLAAADFISFGLVLHISIINELEHYSSHELAWKSTQNGISLIAISLYGALYATAILGEKSTHLIDTGMLLKTSVMFAFLSASLSITMIYYLRDGGEHVE